MMIGQKEKEIIMKFSETQKLVLASFFLALAFVLPFLTANNPELGKLLLPMHIPALLCGFFCGYKYGIVVGLVAPITRSLFFTMPPLYPTAIAMSFELATFGAVTGILYALIVKKYLNVYISLISAMILGRIVYGVISLFLLSLEGKPYTLEAFLVGSFVEALPGIALQIVLIPAVVFAIENLYHPKKVDEVNI